MAILQELVEHHELDRLIEKVVGSDLYPYAFNINPSYKKQNINKNRFRLFANSQYEKRQMTTMVKSLQKSGLFRLKRKQVINGKYMWEFIKK
jgi:hypothetical protein